jgi:hypothetical protein
MKSQSKYHRLSLSESLEAFAKRNTLPLVVARPIWRREGLRILGLANITKMGYLNITPGADISWKPEWKAVEEHD